MSPGLVKDSPMPVAAPLQAKAAAESKKIADAASQFEALFLSEMLKSVREASSGDGTADSEDQSGSSLTELAQEQFAQALAASGGLGFARMVTAQLATGNQKPAAVAPRQPGIEK